MYQNIILTTSEHKNEASTYAQQCGGVVITSCTVFIEQNGSFSETESSSTVYEAYGLKVMDGYEKCESDEKNCDTTSNYPIIEDALCQAGKMVNPRIYIVCSDVAFSNEYGMLYKSAEILNKIPNLNLWIIANDGRLRFFPKP